MIPKVLLFGEGGIRTPGPVTQVNSLAGSPIRPLSHLSKKTEGEGFEPPVSCPTAAFKAATIDLSDILPVKVTKEILGKGRYRVKLYSALTNIKNIFFEVFVVGRGYFSLNFYTNSEIFINESSIIFLSAQFYWSI